MEQLSKEKAIALYDSQFWLTMTDEDIVKFQLFQDRLCMEFSVFHKAMETVLGRPIFTHEFAFRDSLTKEYLGEVPAPTFDEIIGLIPSDKLILITA